MLNKEEIKYTEEMQLFHETVNSDAMYEFIADNKDGYIFLFIPYIFGTSYWGSKMAPDQSFLIPCLHDEDMAYLESIGQMFNRVRGILLILLKNSYSLRSYIILMLMTQLYLEVELKLIILQIIWAFVRNTILMKSTLYM